MAPDAPPRFIRGPQDRLEQTGKAGVEVIAAESVDAGCALRALVDDAGFAKHFEVMGAGRFRDREVEGAASALVALGQRRDDLEPDWVAEGVKDRGEFDLISLGLCDRLRLIRWDCAHTLIVRRSSYI
jgi:hypothetical protein